MKTYKVGELAKLTGLTVRALHYYEELGLLSPTERESNGYRSYNGEDLARLQKIASLKFLGFSLEQVKEYLSSFAKASEDHRQNTYKILLDILPRQIEAIKQNIVNQEILVERLKAMQYYAGHKSPIPEEQFFKVMSMMNNIQSDFNEEEWAAVKAQGKKLGHRHIRAVEAEWPDLIKKVQQLIKDGVDPKDPKVTPLAKRWMELVKEFSGGHKGVEQKVGKMYQEHGSQINFGAADGANMMECIEYVQKALK